MSLLKVPKESGNVPFNILLSKNIAVSEESEPKLVGTAPVS